MSASEREMKTTFEQNESQLNTFDWNDWQDCEQKFRTIFEQTLNSNSPSLILDELEVNDNHILCIVAFLNANPHIPTLSLNNNNLTSNCALTLLKLEAIRTLSLNMNQLGPDGACTLSDTTTLINLALGINGIGNYGAKAFEHNKSIKILFLMGNHIGNQGALALGNNNFLTSLNIAGNPGIDVIGLENFLSNVSITVFNCDHYQTASPFALTLDLRITHNRTVSRLKAKRQQAQNEKDAMAAAVKQLYTIDSDDEEAMALAETALISAMQQMPATSSEFDWHNSTPKLLDVFKEAITEQQSYLDFTNLHVGRNHDIPSFKQITDADIPYILDFLDKHPKVRTLRIEGNLITDVGAQMLAENTTLTSLNLLNNPISDIGVDAFLAHNMTLTKIMISDTYINTDRQDALFQRNQNFPVWLFEKQKRAFLMGTHRDNQNTSSVLSFTRNALFDAPLFKAIFEMIDPRVVPLPVPEPAVSSSTNEVKEYKEEQETKTIQEEQAQTAILALDAPEPLTPADPGSDPELLLQDWNTYLVPEEMNDDTWTTPVTFNFGNGASSSSQTSSSSDNVAQPTDTPAQRRNRAIQARIGKFSSSNPHQ